MNCPLKPKQATKIINNIREFANFLFEKQYYDDAIEQYELALKALDSTETLKKSEAKKMNRLRLEVIIDQIICNYHLNRPLAMIELFQTLDGYAYVNLRKHCKGIFYYGKAYEMLGRPDKAVYSYHKALKLEPGNEEIKQTLKELYNTEKNSIVDDFDTFQIRVTKICRRMTKSRELLVYEMPSRLNEYQFDWLRSTVSDFQYLTLHIQINADGEKTSIKIVKKEDPRFF